jgi:hypothetical protein
MVIPLMTFPWQVMNMTWINKIIIIINLGSSPDDKDDKRMMTSTINNVEVTLPPACD